MFFFSESIGYFNRTLRFAIMFAAFSHSYCKQIKINGASLEMSVPQNHLNFKTYFVVYPSQEVDQHQTKYASMHEYLPQDTYFRKEIEFTALQSDQATQILMNSSKPFYHTGIDQIELFLTPPNHVRIHKSDHFIPYFFETGSLNTYETDIVGILHAIFNSEPFRILSTHVSSKALYYLISQIFQLHADRNEDKNAIAVYREPYNKTGSTQIAFFPPVRKLKPTRHEDIAFCSSSFINSTRKDAPSSCIRLHNLAR